MDINEAKELLNLCEREELRDHAFGDREIFWTFDGVAVAGGYFGSTGCSVWFLDYETERYTPQEGLKEIAHFKDSDAHELVQCGRLKHIERNDMQGDDIPDYRGA